MLFKSKPIIPNILWDLRCAIAHNERACSVAKQVIASTELVVIPERRSDPLQRDFLSAR